MVLFERKDKKKKSTGEKFGGLFWLTVSFLPLWIFWRNIFLTNFYYLNQSVGNGLRIMEKKIAGHRYLLIPFERNGLNDTLKINVQVDDEKNFLTKTERKKTNFQTQLAKNYEVTLYPWGSDIVSADELKGILFWQNGTGIPNGTLLADERAVYVVSEGKKRPFISPQTFEYLGYQWQNIALADVPSEMELGDVLNLQTTHPDGTIFRTGLGSYFIFFQGEKRRVKEDLIKQVWPNFFGIDLKNDQPEYFSTGVFSSLWWRKDLLACQFNLKDEQHTGNVFIVKIDSLEGWKLTDVKAKETSSVFLNPRKSLSLFWKEIKGQLVIKYGFLRKYFK